MPNIFHISEIVDLGIEKERKRRDFYDLASEFSKEPKLKDLFKQLRDWEEEHIRRFTAIREGLEDSEVQETYPGELSAYMQSLVDEKLYTVVTPQEFKKRVTTGLEAINFGISFEKDAVLFFSELKKYTTSTHQAVIQQLINEEKQHIVYLVTLRKELNS